jgi:hypothetical protein
MIKTNKYNDLLLVKSNFNSFNVQSFWYNPIPDELVDEKFIKSVDSTKYFDQNGYDLCPLEQLYAQYNSDVDLTKYRNVRISIHKPWFSQEDKLSGYVLNHSMLLERKGYDGLALEQLRDWSRVNPLLYKLINYKSKWGLDFSLDYVDLSGECMEVLHYEYDGFDINEINLVKTKFENKIITCNFDEIVKDLINKKSEWFNLEFFDQSDWKTKYFNLEPERFKMVGWQ